jgi:hypothetical protein
MIKLRNVDEEVERNTIHLNGSIFCIVLRIQNIVFNRIRYNIKFNYIIIDVIMRNIVK